MREIFFRGKPIINNEYNWIYGYLFKIWNKTYILWGTTNDVPNMIEVIPETVSQFTGFQDINDKKIYEGDLIKVISSDIIEEVVFNDGAWQRADHIFKNRNLNLLDRHSSGYCEIVGNVHD